MEFRILGPLEAFDGTGPVALGGARQRTVLAVLLLHANEVVPTDVLIDELWGGEPPATAKTALQGYVSRLRRALGPAGAALVTRAPGYLLQVAPGQVDRDRFEALVASARRKKAEGNDEAAAAALRDSLALWRGSALADFRYEPFAQTEIARLEELRLAALENRIEIDLAEGTAGDVVGELEALVAAHPLREGLRGQLMLALYRAGRQAQALAAYQDARRVLVDELGIEPSRELQRLERAILRQEPTLEPPAREERGRLAASDPAREARKTVTVTAFVLGHALDGGGRLDPEALLRVKARSLEAIGGVLERHGGTVAGVTGETLVGVFGIPILHEDDALRALRAAVEAHEMLPALAEELGTAWPIRLALRAGVVTGEVVDGAAVPGDALLAAEVVAGAMRLAERAEPGETLLADSSLRLADDAVSAEALDAADLDGIAPSRLLELRADAPAFARRFDAPLVGRERELVQLREAFARSLRERTPHLMTVLGPAGIGKSRLAAELPGLVGDEARVLTGRCLPYGEGITFWPLQEIINGATGDEPVETILDCLGDGPDAELVAGLIGATLGIDDERSATEEEIFWAVSRLLEALARERALVVVLEDLHWAEPTFLDLVEHLAGRACNAPILLVCLARPELLEARPHWAGGKPNATSMLLEPLLPEESEALLDNLIGDASILEATRARITGAAEGNPLFLEQLLALASELGDEAGELPIPPTIEALLAARLDRLGPAERAVLDRASVVGKEFWPEAVAELLPEEARRSTGRHLEALARKELVRPQGKPGGEELYRFRHVLIQQVACGGVPKELRADLHERFAGWLAQHSQGRMAEVQEIVGYHLEQAARYHRELGATEAADRLGREAAGHLGAAGRRARARGDAPGAVNLLGRATALLADDDELRRRLLTGLGGALLETGELERAGVVLSEALDAAEAAGDAHLAARILLQRAFLHLHKGAESDEAVVLAEQSIPLFEGRGDELGLAMACRLVGEADLARGRICHAAESWERGLAHARKAGDRREQSELLVWLTVTVAYGPTTVSEGQIRLDEILDEGGSDPHVTSTVFVIRGLLLGMEGDFGAARDLIARGRATLEELGLKVRAAMAPASNLGEIEKLAGDHAAAVKVLRRGYDALAQMGEKSFLSTIAADLAEALHAEGRDEEAEALAAASEAAAASDDVVSQVGWRSVKARILARRGHQYEALRLVREAVALTDETDMLVERADVRVVLAEVLELAGEAGAAEALAEAEQLYEAKEHVVGAARARALLERARLHSLS
jgi:predicted ATPase/DNA-binding SARP family transcriptional activator